jgi:hypothetical protein
MARIAKKIVSFVLLILLFEFLAASFFTMPVRPSREAASYDVQHSSLLLPTFLKDEKEKKLFSILIASVKIFTPNRNLTVREDPKTQEILSPFRPPRFALFCSLRI